MSKAAGRSVPLQLIKTNIYHYVESDLPRLKVRCRKSFLKKYLTLFRVNLLIEIK